MKQIDALTYPAIWITSDLCKKCKLIGSSLWERVFTNGRRSCCLGRWRRGFVNSLRPRRAFGLHISSDKRSMYFSSTERYGGVLVGRGGLNCPLCRFFATIVTGHTQKSFTLPSMINHQHLATKRCFPGPEIVEYLPRYYSTQTSYYFLHWRLNWWGLYMSDIVSPEKEFDEKGDPVIALWRLYLSFQPDEAFKQTLLQDKFECLVFWRPGRFREGLVVRKMSNGYRELIGVLSLWTYSRSWEKVGFGKLNKHKNWSLLDFLPSERRTIEVQ